MPQFQWMDDAEVGGLHLRIYPPKAYGISNKVFYLKYGSSVERKVYRIGTWGELTLADARDEARRLRTAFYDLGVDPNRAKKERLRKAQARFTVKELCELYLEDRAPAWSDSYTASNRLHASRVVDALGAKYADSLTKDDVAPVFLDIKRKSPSQAALKQPFPRQAGGEIVFYCVLRPFVQKGKFVSFPRRAGGKGRLRNTTRTPHVATFASTGRGERPSRALPPRTSRAFQGRLEIVFSSTGRGERPSQARAKTLESPRSIVFYDVLKPFFKKGI